MTACPDDWPPEWRHAYDKAFPPPPPPDPWDTLARPEQLPPDGDWLVWLYLAGRGAGKTRSAAEYVKAKAREHPGARIALVARTFADGRDTMVEGESGLLSIIPEAELRGGSTDAAWNRSLGELFMANGSRFKIYSSERPGSLRGPQHGYAWCDEIAAWYDAHLGDADDTTWANLMLGLRLGADPRVVVSTTPKPVRLLRGTRDRPGLIAHTGTVVTRGTTYDNLANLAPTFRQQVLERYEGTRLGRQELNAELLEDVEGALWVRDWIDRERRVAEALRTLDIARMVVAVDPSGGSGIENDEQGIVVAGRGVDGRGYVVADRTCKLTPDGWGRRAVQAWLDFAADAIVVEVNFGGDMAKANIETAAQAMAREGQPTSSVPVRMVHASRGKAVRAEPVAALYEQRRVSHVGLFDEMEDELVSWTPESGQRSPNRLDALVWALTELMVGGTSDASSVPVRDERLRGRR